MPETYEFNPVSWITADAVGPPGQRTFFLQARQGSRLISLKVEKEQVLALAGAIEELLERVGERFPLDESKKDAILNLGMNLQEPIEPVFVVGQMGLGFDEERDLVVLVAQELLVDEESQTVTPWTTARFWGTREQMKALSEYGSAVAAAGRPLCPLCGQPIDPGGHFCPPSNGHNRATFA